MNTNRDITGLILFVLFFALYMTSRTNVHGPAEDSWMMVLDFTRSTNVRDWLHHHHLVYGVIAHYWWVCWRWMGLTDAFMVIQSLNCLFGAMSVWLTYRIGCELRLSRKATVWASVAVGITFVCWWLSSEIEVAAMSLMVSLLVVRQLWHIHLYGATVKRTLVIAGLIILAVSAHIFHIVWALLAAYIVYRSADPKRIRLQLAGGFFILFFLGVIALYALADILAGTRLGPVGYLIGYYETTPGNISIIKAPFLFLVGVIRSLFGVEILFRFTFLTDFLSQLFPAKDFSDEVFLVRNINPVIAVILTVGMIVFGIGLLTALIIAVKRFPRLPADDRRIFLFLTTGVLTVVTPIFISGPLLVSGVANNEHFPLFWALIFLLIAMIFDKTGNFSGINRMIPIVALVVLLGVNGLGTIRAMKDPSNDLTVARFAPWQRLIEPDDTLIVHLIDYDAAALSYLTGATTINTITASETPDARWIRFKGEGGWIQVDVLDTYP